MPNILHVLYTIVFSYLFGSFQSSYIFGRLFYKKDIRNYGSGNPGATNAYRVFGIKFAVLCLILDAFKGGFAVYLAGHLFGGTDPIVIKLIAGLAAVIGHNHPFYMNFKGGKGVAASIGIILMIDWRVFLIAAVPALLILALTRIMSVASLAFEAFTLFLFIFFYFSNENLVLIGLLAALYPLISFWRHRSNIVRLINGEEPRLWGKGHVKHSETDEKTETTEE